MGPPSASSKALGNVNVKGGRVFVIAPILILVLIFAINCLDGGISIIYHYLSNVTTTENATQKTNETPRLVAGALSNHYDNGNRANCTITNATFEFIKSLAKDGDIQQVNNTPHLPAKLLNISLAFQPVTVGEEFLHLGDYLELLGKKLVSREPIKIVWFGGSNTEGRSPNPFVKQVQNVVNIQYTTSSDMYIIS